MILDTADEFAAWLTTLPGNKVIGVAGSSLACPIATFLKARGFPHPVVGLASVLLNGGLPYNTGRKIDWVCRFIDQVDTGCDVYEPRTVDDALAALTMIGYDARAVAGKG